jgi:hypothetical protein
VAYRFISVAATVLLAACTAQPERIEVRVPVPVRTMPPTELSTPWQPPPVPAFVLPSDPAASSGLTPDGESRLRTLLLDALTRIRAWEAWGNEAE